MTALSEKNRYQAYPEYKDSGVEWSDTLPLSWGEVNLRWISTIYAGGTPSKTNQSFWENGTVPWINSGAVNQGLVTKPSTLITEQAYQNSSAKWIPKGSLVVALAGQGKTKGMVAQLAIDSTCNQSMGAIVPECSEYSRYLYWWITSNYQNIRNMAGGDLRDGLNLEHLGSIQCPQPSIDESVSIANFLDHETAKIDTLIEKQQQLIKLLKEKRQAVISYAVTKGLNPQAPTKDSGVEWLGEVPEHWVVAGFKKYLASIVDYRGKTPNKVESGRFLVTARNIKKGRINYLSSAEYVSEADYAQVMSRGVPNIGDVLFTTEAPLGEVAQVDNSDIALAQRVIKFCGQSGVLDNTYLKYFIMSDSFQDSLMTYASGSTALGIKAERLVYLRQLLPPLSEQTQIVTHIEAVTTKIDLLEQKAIAAIDLMQERRTALISAAVTGKIDVRNWQAPISQNQAMEQTA
ncbi:restriction endonuclease subunit S [Vibrio metschnikovii]|nr:restriction endonuclease subunit S [Vibrio metschnikovii]EKO3570054.1 restriction endonuclease subunit S [Vibrio metschnikovii]EKO3604741.1 restriction endonuclease subunit S [Vibrio metschnikovii]EKO3764079.1 restriction endonuclease subunit S [Vibrio metschnikovii]EKO3767513.1 restriction endonuclease subunit S [Vibrio metschnikovii]